MCVKVIQRVITFFDTLKKKEKNKSAIWRLGFLEYEKVPGCYAHLHLSSKAFRKVKTIYDLGSFNQVVNIVIQFYNYLHVVETFLQLKKQKKKCLD